MSAHRTGTTITGAITGDASGTHQLPTSHFHSSAQRDVQNGELSLRLLLLEAFVGLLIHSL
jgi:hypothetical protein